MGRDPRRGAGFPPERDDDILQGGKTNSQRSRQAHFASRRRMLGRNGGQIGKQGDFLPAHDLAIAPGSSLCHSHAP